MSRKLALVLALGLAVAIIAACDRQKQAAAVPVHALAASSPAAAPLVTPSVGPYDGQANWPARSGLNNDPDNPNGAPGPSTGTGTSVVR